MLTGTFHFCPLPHLFPLSTMMHSSTVLAALAVLAAPAAAQNLTFLTQLLQEFQSLNLTSLANASSVINSTTTGQSLLATLSSGPLTVFAPNNDAFVGLHPNISSSPELLAEVLSYHVVPGTFNGDATFPNTTIGRTLLNASDLVFLEGNKNQVLAWTEKNGTLSILNQNTPATVVNTTTFGNLTIHVTNAVIDVPGELTAALSANNLTSFTAALQAAAFLETLDSMHGVTIFAPSDAAFSAVQSNLTAAGSNSSILSTILRNHVINGTSVYSGNLIGLGSGNNETTAAGEGLSASFNSSGGFVTNGNVTAKIETPDIILWNGVLHIIDTVLFNEDENDSAAVSAASSASAAATSSASESGPIGFTQSATSASSSGSGSSGSSSAANAKANLLNAPLKSVGVAGAVSILGVVFGGLLAL